MSDEPRTEEEIARLRDEVVRRMANTPPKPKPPKGPSKPR